MVRDLFEDVGLAVVALGVAMFSVPAGVIVAGLLIVLAAQLHNGRSQPVKPGDAEAPPADAGAGNWPDQ